MIDDRKEIGDFRMTRATYFYVESIEPSTDIPTEIAEIDLPVFSLEFSGIIYKPLKGEEIFTNSEQIEDLYLEVEKHESLYVDSDNIWVPNRLFNRQPERGDIFRINHVLFIQLYVLCKDDAHLYVHMENVQASEGEIVFSEIETEAFNAWIASIIEKAKTNYPKNPELKLDW